MHGAARSGVYLTPNGYRLPIYGMSRVHDASGHAGTQCDRLTDTQIEAERFGRRVSRAMLVSSPHAVIQSGTTGATFEIIYSDPQGQGFNDPDNEDARNALEAAVLAWTKVIQGTVTIKIDASMPDEDNQDLLASAGPVDSVEIDHKLVPNALAWQLLKKRNTTSGTASAADIEVHVNPNQDWDYALDGVAEEGMVSFVYTLIHELGHGLGFSDSFDNETGKLLNELPTPFDVYINRGVASRNAVKDHAADAVKRDLVSNDLFFSGDNAIEASRRSIKPLPMIKLYAPDPFEEGSSIAHVDQDTYADLKTGLMCPRDFGSGGDKIDALTLSIMKDIGYSLVPNAVVARVR